VVLFDWRLSISRMMAHYSVAKKRVSSSVIHFPTKSQSIQTFSLVSRKKFFNGMISRSVAELKRANLSLPTSILSSFRLGELSFSTEWTSRFPQTLLFKRQIATNDYPEHNMIGLPALSPSMDQGNIVKWKKKEGDKVKQGDILAEIETDKATVDFESTEDGFLAKILLPAGTRNLKIGTPIGILVENESDIAAFKNFQLPATSPSAPEEQGPSTFPPSSVPPKSVPLPAAPPVSQTAPMTVPGAPPPPSATPLGKVISSPRARMTAIQEQVNLSDVIGTGPSGRILQSDVLEHARSVKENAGIDLSGPSRVNMVPSGTASYTDIAHTQIRRVIAQRLSLSKQTIPHYYLTMECQVDELLKLRTRLNEKAAGQYKLSLNDFIIKASALACRKVPEANSSWNNDFIRQYHTVDINVAVNTDRGLLTPLIPNVDTLGLLSIATTVKRLAEKAKDSKLSPSELAVGTFTISNLGMFGIKQFAAVINPPQACILAVGSAEKKVYALEESSSSSTMDKANPKFSVGSFLYVTLSCDHRVVDGAVGAQWLKAFRDYMEDPTKMLL